MGSKFLSKVKTCQELNASQGSRNLLSENDGHVEAVIMLPLRVLFALILWSGTRMRRIARVQGRGGGMPLFYLELNLRVLK